MENNIETKLPLKWLVAAGVVIIAIVVLYFSSDFHAYNKAENLLSDGKYKDAITAFSELGDYKDSKERISECNRRILYDFLQDSRDYTLHATQYSYGLTAKEGKISISVSFADKNVDFSILLDMKSDKGKFICECAPLPLLETTSDGDFKISQLKKSENSLEIDNVSGYYDAKQMKRLVQAQARANMFKKLAIFDKKRERSKG